MEVKDNFARWLDEITNKFLASLRDIDNTGDLKQMKGTDTRVLQQLDEMRDIYINIVKIFSNIGTSAAEDKVKCI